MTEDDKHAGGGERRIDPKLLEILVVPADQDLSRL